MKTLCCSAIIACTAWPNLVGHGGDIARPRRVKFSMTYGVIGRDAVTIGPRPSCPVSCGHQCDDRQNPLCQFREPGEKPVIGIQHHPSPHPRTGRSFALPVRGIDVVAVHRADLQAWPSGWKYRWKIGAFFMQTVPEHPLPQNQNVVAEVSRGQRGA